jgi:hypothetical protein
MGGSGGGGLANPNAANVRVYQYGWHISQGTKYASIVLSSLEESSVSFEFIYN